MNMKRYVVLVGIVAALLLLLFLRPHNGNDTIQEAAEGVTTRSLADASSSRSNAVIMQPERGTVANPVAIATNQDNEFFQLVRKGDDASNKPVAFYGLVVDQDSNALQNVDVDLAVVETWSDPLPQGRTKTTPLQRRTGTDGRFEVSDSGLRGKFVEVYTLTKDGYKQDNPRLAHGMCGSGSSDDPMVFRIWDTNIPNEQLITGDVQSVIIPDGRWYGVDLTKKVISEGAEGDLVVRLKRPTEVGWDKYEWSCELTVDGGGLLDEISDQTMLIAPATGYTNVFAFRQEAAVNDWTHGLYGKRFYIMLRNGQTYGRITVNLTANPNRKAPATLRVQYVVNPSGSRFLR